MMGLGPMGSETGVYCSSSSSSSISTSNLSASARPFTVDRLSPNSSSNPNLHCPKSPYSTEPYSRTWQYAAPARVKVDGSFLSEKANVDSVGFENQLNQDNISNYRNAFSPHEKCVRPVDSPFSGPVWVVRCHPPVVIRPPPATNGNLGRGVASGRPVCKEDSFETNLFSFSKQGSDQISISSTSVKEPLTPQHVKGAYDGTIKARSESQLPDTNALGDIPVTSNGVQSVNSSEGCSDFIDHNNTGVDSPCWKGATSSQFSLFDVEADNSKHVKKKLNEYCEDHQNLLSTIDSTRLISEKSGEVRKYDEKECTKNGDICSREIIDGPDILSKESGLLNNLKSGFDMQISGPQHFVVEDGTGMALDDVPEGGDVAFHVAEKVPDSPSSQEDATEPTKLLDPKLNVPTLIKAIHNLSELLLFHLSSDACSLDEENNETLKHIIINLDSCMTKKIAQVNNMSEPNNLVRDTVNKLGKSCNMGATARSPRAAHKAEKSIQTDYQRVHDGKIIYNISGEKDDKPAIFSPLGDDIDKTRDDVMAEGIKNVLEDNFHFDAEMHSQALLFKSLWLETEAKLCSISCKARFDRMKNQMKKFKLKAPRENEDNAEMMPKVCISPDPTTACQLSPKACDVTIPISTSQNFTISSTSVPGSDVEASVMARFNILKSRENLKPTSNEMEKQSKMVGDEHGSPIMTKFNILKSQEEMSKLINTEEEKQPGMVDSEHAGPVMARFNMLKSREEKSKSINTEEEKQPDMIDGEHAGPFTARLNILKSRDGNSKSVHMEDGRTPDSEMADDELYNCSGYPSTMNDPVIGSLNSSSSNSRIINQDYSVWRDSCSSDWEHVLKDDFFMEVKL